MLAFALLAFAVTSVSAAVLENFQVNQPVIVPKDAKQCTIRILQRDFAWSYGMPEIVTYNPPTDCGTPGTWAAITLNLTVTSNGTQYDRLGHFTFQNVEIWRTSTPEPTRGDGIRWTYIKDVTRYTPLFAKSGPFIFQLDNIIQTGLDGVYSTVVYATFYASSSKHPPAKTSDLIVPITTLRNDTSNHASTPPGFSRNITLPRNVLQIFAEIQASGNAQEEFWYFNAPNRYLKDLPPDTTYGQGPFREVRLLVDGTVAGVVNPYVTMYTGAFVPSIWRPVPSYGALDLPNYYLDLTPFVPLFADGKPHVVTLDVISAEDDHAVLQNWYVSGLLQVFLDPSGLPTTGTMSNDARPYPITLSSGEVKPNGDVSFNVASRRNLQYYATIVGGSGKVIEVSFTQWLQYSNFQTYFDKAQKQTVLQTSFGTMWSRHNGEVVLVDVFSYPVKVNYDILNAEGTRWTAEFDHTYWRDSLPSPLVQRTNIQTQQLASGTYNISPNGNFGEGTSNTNFTYSDAAGNSYKRHVIAVNSRITFDELGGNLARGLRRVEDGADQSVEAVDAPPRLPGRSL